MNITIFLAIKNESMSFSANRRDALDPNLPLKYRASHARSCALLVAEKWRIHRSLVIDVIRQRCGVNLEAVENEDEISTAIKVLEDLKIHGVAPST